MATFYYYSNAKLHICNKQLLCSDESYERICKRGRVTDTWKEILHYVQKYHLLTEEMLCFLMKRPAGSLGDELDVLMEYGLIVKQFYEGVVEDEPMRTLTFYSQCEHMPSGAYEPSADVFEWNGKMKIADACAKLAFNQFNIALIKSVPAKAIQSQPGYVVKGVTVEGMYRLKSRKYRMGYSRMAVLSVRDFGDHNAVVTKVIAHIVKCYTYEGGKIPWFVLLCENKKQCARISRRIKADPATAGAEVYFLLDTDFELYENPLHYLQTFHFRNGEKEIYSESYKITDWF